MTELLYGQVGPDDVHFQVRRLSAYDPGLRGRVRYCWEGAGPGDGGATTG